MTIWDLIFGKKVDCSVQEADNAKLRAQIKQMQEERDSSLDALNKRIAELSSKNIGLSTENMDLHEQVAILGEQLKEVAAEMPEAEYELAQITERIQSVLNMSLHGVDFIWRDKGYVVQIHPDSKFDETKDYPVLRDRVNLEMQNSKFCEVQEINFRTFFIKVKS